MQVSPDNQDKEDLNDTIESLVVNLAMSQEHQVLGMLINYVNSHLISCLLNFFYLHNKGSMIA